MTSRKVSHRSIGLAVVGFWLVMMGFLAYRELGDVFSSTTFRPTPSRELGKEAESWMGLFAGEDRVGHIHMSQAVEKRQDLEGWVWMDPTLDQPLADATHVKLLNGSWTGLLPLIGELEIEVLEIE